MVYTNNEARYTNGFTLIEVLVVIALIGFLAAITIIAINPAQNFRDARNTQRRSDVTQILNAITQYTTQQGNTLAGLGTIPTCPTLEDIGTGVGNLNLATGLVPNYIVAIPTDPNGGTASDTLYDICQTAGGRVTVSAPGAESVTISVSR